VVVPFHAGRDLHPKIIKQALRALEDALGEGDA